VAGKPLGGLVEHLFRHSSGRILSGLTRALGAEHLELAEECVQGAFVRALEVWPYRGLPENPAGWLSAVARNTALDRLRREANLRRKVAALDPPAGLSGDARFDDEAAMILMCCHPEIPAESRIALTLKTVSGFSVAEVARALLSSESAAAQRIVRAKRIIRERGIALALPSGRQDGDRLESTLDVIYLMFNEGYAARGDDLTRGDLCDEAIRLVEILAGTPAVETPGVHALASLLCLQASRLEARIGPDGEMLLLPDQDRALWNRGLIERGLRHLERAAKGPVLSAFHLEAAIAACHATASSPASTDWAAILGLYDRLLDCNPSPVVRVNRAVALSMVNGPRAALEALEAAAADPALARYGLLSAARGEMWERAGDADRAADCYRKALELPCSAPERRFLESKLRRIAGAD